MGARACWILLAGLLASPAFAAAQPLAVSEVAPGVFVHFGAVADWAPGNRGDVANLGFIVGSRCVAVIDTGGTPEVGAGLRAAVLRATKLPVCYVINTHAHPDHILGNVAFAEPDSTVSPRFVASAKFSAGMAGRERSYLNALERDFGIKLSHTDIKYPSLTVEREIDLDLGDRVLALQAWPTAHTDHDLTVYDRKTRTLLLSDLLFVQHMPVVDGSLRGWLAVMADLKRIDVALAIPGHGPASTDWPGVMAPQEAYLNALLRETRAAIKARLTIGQAVAQVGTEAASHWSLAEQFHRRNVTTAYAELEWEE